MRMRERKMKPFAIDVKGGESNVKKERVSCQEESSKPRGERKRKENIWY